MSLRLYVTVAFLPCTVLHAQSGADWFPVHIGDKWIYRHTTRDDIGEGRAHLDVHTWTTEEITIGTWQTSQGTIVQRQVGLVAGGLPAGSRIDPSQPYLVRGDCLYGPDYSGAAWDPSTHQLTLEFIKGLATYSSPDFCFPLVPHKTWGAPRGPDWNVIRPEDAKDWQVAAVIEHDPSAPDRGQTFHIASISSYPGSGMTVDLWFEKGVGVVRKDDIHHGTIGEIHTRLIRFEPAPRNFKMQ